MVGSGGDEDRISLRDVPKLALDLDIALAVEHDVDLVERMRRLTVGLGSDEHVDADLESGRLVDDLVPTALAGQPLGGASNVEALHERERTTQTTSVRMSRTRMTTPNSARI